MVCGSLFHHIKWLDLVGGFILLGFFPNIWDANWLINVDQWFWDGETNQAVWLTSSELVVITG